MGLRNAIKGFIYGMYGASKTEQGLLDDYYLRQHKALQQAYDKPATLIQQQEEKHDVIRIEGSKRQYVGYAEHEHEDIWKMQLNFRCKREIVDAVIATLKMLDIADDKSYTNELAKAIGNYIPQKVPTTWINDLNQWTTTTGTVLRDSTI